MAAPSPRKRTTTKRAATKAKSTTGTTARSRTARPAPDPELEGLDLDALEHEGERPEPYAFHLEGEQFYIEDPIDLDWQPVLSVHPRDTIKALKVWMGDEQFLRFAGLSLPLWKMNELSKRVMDHFDLTPEAAGEGNALPPL